MRGVRWAAWAVAALVLGVGCGDAGDSGDSPAPTGGQGGTAGAGGSAGKAGAGASAGQAGQGGAGSGGAAGSAGAGATAGSAGSAAGAGSGGAGTGGAGTGGAGTGGAGSGGAGTGGAGSGGAGSGGAGTGGVSGSSGQSGGAGAGAGGAPAEQLCCSTSQNPGCDGLPGVELTDAQKAIQACVCAGVPECCAESWNDTCTGAVAQLGCGTSCEFTEKPCEGAADCDDGVFCNGVEGCSEGKCTKGEPPTCDDQVSCTEDFCDQKEDACKHNKSDVACSDGKFCNGIEVCDPAAGDPKTGCMAGTPVVCDDGVACTVDVCDDALGACAKTYDDAQCDDGVFCDGKETCGDGGCAAGAPVNCDDGFSCTIDSCDEAQKKCTNEAVNSACDDGKACNGVETCDPAKGAAVTGCVAGVAVPCASDSIACTVDACDEATGQCEHRADNALCNQGQFCIPLQKGCVAAPPCLNDAQCDDGDACNGKETCQGVCKPGTPVNCNDGVSCTVDSCDPKTGACTNAPNDQLCDDGKACSGVEVCDAKLGCQKGTPVVCDDGFSCTVDTCQEPTGTCVSAPFDAFCDDGQLCNGAETCDPAKGAAATGCLAGKPYVCPSDGIACTQDICDPALNACVSKEDDSKCGCGQTCSAAKGGCGNFCVVRACSNGKVYACGDCKDNDGDCKVDAQDSQCLGACDNTENAGPTQGSGCFFAPPPGTFNPKLRCSWGGTPNGGLYPAAKDATMTPVVINLTDDNADGKIDGKDTPDIAFISYPDVSGEVNKGVLRVVSGKCGVDTAMTLHYSVGTNEIQADTGQAGLWFDFSGGIAAGDIDADGLPDLVASLNGGGTIALSNTGKVKWIQAAHPKGATDYAGGGTPSIADLDGDGKPEIITGRVVLNGKDGTLKWKGTAGVGFNGFLGPVSTVADIDGDGKLNVLAGNTAYRHDGTVLWTYARIANLVTTGNCQATNVGACDGFTAVGNFDADDQGEVVVVSAGRIFILNHDGTPMKVNGANVEIALPVSTCTKNEGGPPTVADFDGDGQPEIGVAGSNYYIVADLECLATPKPASCSDAGIRWKVANNDCSSRVTGSSVFDFDGDGNAEVIYNDEVNFRIFDGKTGAILFQQANHSRTRLEMPIVADVDNDGKAEVVFVENDSGQPGSARHGLRVWGDANNTWVSTRRIWNQHSYHVTNVNEFGKIPAKEKANWLEPTTATVAGKMNNFRQNLPEYDALSAPDLSVSTTFNQSTCPAQNGIVARVCNKGLLKVAAGVTVKVFDENSKTEIACASAPVTKTDLDPDACEEVTCLAAGNLAATVLRVCVDNGDFDCSTGGANECNEENNISVVPTLNCPIQ